MKITVIAHLEKKKASALDVVVDQVARALRQSGHRVSVLGVHSDVSKLIAGIRRRRPDLVFNLMEMFGRDVLGDVDVAGLLDLLHVPYTGCGPGEFYLQGDKSLTKKLLAFDSVPYPDFAVFSREEDLEIGGKLRFPLFVKPLRLDGSIGITAKAVVHNTPELLSQVSSIHEKVRDSALVEEYIEGREFYVGILGNDAPTVFPPIEMDFSGLPREAPPVLDAAAKWKVNSAEYKGTRAITPDLSEELRARLQQVARDAYRAVRVRDYGRIDLRLTSANQVYVIEVNASCYLEESSEFAMAARAAGLDYADLINRIAAIAAERHRKRGPGPRVST